jgi:hypothetical protein
MSIALKHQPSGEGGLATARTTKSYHRRALKTTGKLSKSSITFIKSIEKLSMHLVSFSMCSVTFTKHPVSFSKHLVTFTKRSVTFTKCSVTFTKCSVTFTIHSVTFTMRLEKLSKWVITFSRHLDDVSQGDGLELLSIDWHVY